MACPNCNADTRDDTDRDGKPAPWWCLDCLHDKCHLAYAEAQARTAGKLEV